LETDLSAKKGNKMKETFWWQKEFQYLLDRKILSRDEFAYLFGQIRGIIGQETNFLKKEIYSLQQKIQEYQCNTGWAKVAELEQEIIRLTAKVDELKNGENDWWQKRWINNDLGKQLFEIRQKWLTAFQCAENWQKMYEEEKEKKK
jgi:hypothetical protein